LSTYGQLVSDATETKLRIEGERYALPIVQLRGGSIFFVALEKNP
jgi:hypothetical protein